MLGIVEGAWHPGNKALERQLVKEMDTYGTLENPFSIEYLDCLLKRYGFIDQVRYISVNGFFTPNKRISHLVNFQQHLWMQPII